jgi:hypothetical protein
MERDEEDEEWGFIEDDGEDRNGTRGTNLFSRGASISTGSLSFSRAQRLTAAALVSRARPRDYPQLLRVRALRVPRGVPRRTRALPFCRTQDHPAHRIAASKSTPSQLAGKSLTMNDRSTRQCCAGRVSEVAVAGR